MPTLPLFDPTAHPDGWHDVLAPGGYEWWYFDAGDESTDTRIVVIFMAGFIFHPGYLRAYDRYMKRPTKHRPPVGADCPCVYGCVYRKGKVWKQFFTQFKREDFSAASDRVDVRIGDGNRVRENGAGYDLKVLGSPWRLTRRGPVRSNDETLSIELSCARDDSTPPTERRFLSRRMTGTDHFWTIAAPRCRVSGALTLTRAGADERLDFSGRGYHDHNFGAAPIRDGVGRWIWGRAMFRDRVLIFHHAEPKSKALPAETHLVQADDAGQRDLAFGRFDADWSRVCKPALFLKYPQTMRFGDELTLTNPRVIDASPFYLRLTCDAVSRGETATAFCELAHPHRLSLPVLGRLIEMSFDKRPTRR